MAALGKLTVSRSVLEDEAKQYRRIYAATFLVFLGAAVIARLLPPRFRLFALDAGRRRSILAEARATAHASIAFAFMH